MNPRFRIGLPLKFMLSVSVVILLTSFMLTWFFAKSQVVQIRTGLEDKCRSLSQNLAFNSEYGVVTGNKGFLDTLSQGLIKEENVIYSLIYDNYGTVLSSAQTANLPEEVASSSQTVVDCCGRIQEAKYFPATYTAKRGEPVYEVITPIIVKQITGGPEEIVFLEDASFGGKETVVGAARVGISLSRMNKQIADTRRGVLLLTLGVTVIGIFISAFLVRFIVRPIRELVVGTEKLARGELEYRVAIKSNDEIGDLAGSFNAMSEELKRYVKALNKEKEDLLRARKELEQRTAELESTLEKMKGIQQELLRAEKFAAIGRLASSVAHELRNPLTSLKNISYYLQKVGVFTDDKSKAMLTMLTTDVTRANKIVTDLLDFSRIKKLVKSQVKVNEFVGTVLDQMGLPESIEVVRKLDPVEAMLDPDRMQQVLVNLIGNARDAMSGGGRLTVTTKLVGGLAGIIVEDTGCGMDKETSDHIFEPLFTTKTKGLGLGLAIVKEIVDAHVGTIHVASEKGKGTSFTIILPVLGGADGEQKA